MDVHDDVQEGKAAGASKRAESQEMSIRQANQTGLSVENAVNTIHSLDEQIKNSSTEKDALETQVHSIEESMDRVIPFADPEL